ncbi:MAG: acetylxylan esterase [Acidobacteria bacterium]|nr:acetylxylan esterase [Acidobacteriota bacterium]
MNALRKHRTLALAAVAFLPVLAIAESAAADQAPASQAQGNRTLMSSAPTSIPAPTLRKPATPQASPDAEGFIPRWLLLEPIPAPLLTQNAVQEEVHKDYFPDQFTVIPRDGDQVTVGNKELTWHAVDTKLYNVNLFHFAREHGMSAENVLFWAVAIVNCPKETPNVRLAIGSNSASVWWVNGEELIGIYGDRQTIVDDGVSKRITLKRGPNVIRAAVINGGGATDFCARFLDEGGKPLKGYTVTLSAGGR